MSGPAVLPSWMYGDPADVAERKEQAEIGRAERQARQECERAAREQRERFGLVGDGTVRLIKQQRIRQLVAATKEGRR